MNELLLVGILALNIAISVWNCYAVGTAWKDVMALGSGFEKLLLWCGVIQSGVGFSMPILLILSFGATTYLTAGAEPTLTAAEGAAMMQQVFSLWYVAVIFPVLGSGLAITAHSIRAAWQRRDLASIGVAGWNTFAQISNTVSAANNIGFALEDVGKLFKGAGDSGDSKGKLGAIVLLLVALSLAGGFLVAFGLVRKFSRESVSRAEQLRFARA